jgi:adenine-specific DNA-methyltransferase
MNDIVLNSNNTPCVKERPFLEDGSIREKLAKTTWYKGEYDTGSSGKYLKNLFNKNNDIFENPKSVILIKDILKIATNKNDIILDFFAGSGTTGDAVMRLNVEDGGNRKYILVQLPEPIDPKKSKTAYDFVKNELGVENPTIFDITKERLIRAAKKIKEEIIEKSIVEKEKKIEEIRTQFNIVNKDEEINKLQEEIKRLKNQDLGFKIFETVPILDSCN